MRLADLDEIRENAIRWERQKEREERAENFKKVIAEFNAYEERIGDSTKINRKESDEPWMWLDPRDKKVKKIKSAGGSLASIIASAELRESFF